MPTVKIHWRQRAMMVFIDVVWSHHWMFSFGAWDGLGRGMNIAVAAMPRVFLMQSDYIPQYPD